MRAIVKTVVFPSQSHFRIKFNLVTSLIKGCWGFGPHWFSLYGHNRLKHSSKYLLCFTEKPNAYPVVVTH